MATVTIREARPGDLPAIRAVHDSAFGATAESELVARLTHDGLAIASVVAVDVVADQIVGHVLFSALPLVSPDGEMPAASLAPLAVMPNWQRRGIGSALVRYGLDLCLARNVAAVLVLGDVAYYQRFGFTTELGARIESPYAGAHFMALELRAKAIAPGSEARYPAAFADLD